MRTIGIETTPGAAGDAMLGSRSTDQMRQRSLKTDPQLPEFSNGTKQERSCRVHCPPSKTAAMQAELRLLSVILACFSLLSTPRVNCQETKAARTKPNVVILLADDLGYDDLSLRGSETLQTPRIDAFANQSVQFNNFYSHASDAPSRAALLTGNHFLKTGIWGENAARNFLSLELPTLSNISELNNYTTGLFGGWPNGDSPGYNPRDRNFQESCAVQLHYYYDNNATCHGNVTTLEGWIAEAIADKAIGFIKENVANPFMLYLPFITPHVGQIERGQPLEYHAPAELVEKYLEMKMSNASAAFHAAVEFLDTQVGRILDEIDMAGLGNNTVVFFLSDNGPDQRKFIPETEWLARKLSKFRGEKGELYENGIKPPLFVRWTGTFEPSVVNQALVTIYDILPTILELGGIPSGSLSFDGMSFVELLQNSTVIGDTWWSNRTIYDAWQAPGNTAAGKSINKAGLPGWGVVNKTDFELGSGNGQWMARKGDMKLLIVDKEEFLFNITEDPTESDPVKDSELSESLLVGLGTWWKAILASNLSFSSPKYWVKRGVKESKVDFMGAAEMSENITIKGFSAEFEATNDTFFRFDMRVVDSGKYRIKYKVQTPPSTWKGTPLVTMACGNDTAVVDRVPKGKVERWIGIINLNFTGDNCSLEFKVKNGTGNAIVEWLAFVPWIEKEDLDKTKSTGSEQLSTRNETKLSGEGKSATTVTVETSLQEEGVANVTAVGARKNDAAVTLEAQPPPKDKEAANVTEAGMNATALTVGAAFEAKGVVNLTEATGAGKNVTGAVELPINGGKNATAVVGNEKNVTESASNDKNVTSTVEAPVGVGNVTTAVAEEIETPTSKNLTAGSNNVENELEGKKASDAGRKLLTWE